MFFAPQRQTALLTVWLIAMCEELLAKVQIGVASRVWICTNSRGSCRCRYDKILHGQAPGWVFNAVGPADSGKCLPTQTVTQRAQQLTVRPVTGKMTISSRKSSK